MEYVLDRPDVRGVWKKFTEHEFVSGLGSGLLPVERFKQYLAQDYLYLVKIYISMGVLSHGVLTVSRFTSRFILLEATLWRLTRGRPCNLLLR